MTKGGVLERSSIPFSSSDVMNRVESGGTRSILVSARRFSTSAYEGETLSAGKSVESVTAQEALEQIADRLAERHGNAMSMSSS